MAIDSFMRSSTGEIFGEKGAGAVVKRGGAGAEHRGAFGVEQLDAEAFRRDVDHQLLGDVGERRVGGDGLADLAGGLLELAPFAPLDLGPELAFLGLAGFGLLFAVGIAASLGAAVAGAGAGRRAGDCGGGGLGRNIAGVVLLVDRIGLGAGELDRALVGDERAFGVGGVAGEGGAGAGWAGGDVAGGAEIIGQAALLLLGGGVEKPHQQKECHHRGDEVGVRNFPGAAVMAGFDHLVAPHDHRALVPLSAAHILARPLGAD